jgi:hypothetical protein
MGLFPGCPTPRVPLQECDRPIRGQVRFLGKPIETAAVRPIGRFLCKTPKKDEFSQPKV